MALAHSAGVAVAFWLLAFGGLEQASVTTGDTVRRWLILGCAGAYLVRGVVTSFWIGKREVSWAEGIGLGLYFAAIHVILASLAGSITAEFSTLDVGALELYGFGAFLTTKSEIDRARWKRIPENTGRLYTQGWFRLSRHINFFGEVVLMVGYALLTRRAQALAIPATVFAFFAFVNIPLLEDHLSSRYGKEFEAYAQHTKRLVPWIY